MLKWEMPGDEVRNKIRDLEEMGYWLMAHKLRSHFL